MEGMALNTHPLLQVVAVAVLLLLAVALLLTQLPVCQEMVEQVYRLLLLELLAHMQVAVEVPLELHIPPEQEALAAAEMVQTDRVEMQLQILVEVVEVVLLALGEAVAQAS